VQRFGERLTTNIEKRAATTFSIVGLAGELAIEYDLLPWEKGAAFEAALLAFKRYQTYLESSQTEDSQILQAVSDFIAKHGDSRFSSVSEHPEKSVQNRAGWYKNDDKGRVYMFFP
jgi:putative DNA primase/helicase